MLELRWIEPAPTRFDVLFVVDSSPAMLAYRAPLEVELRGAFRAIGLVGAYYDVHVGVLTGDLGVNAEAPQTPMPGQCAGWGDAAALRRSALADDAFVQFREGPRGTWANVRSSVADALASLAQVGAGCAHIQPLEAMRIALGGEPHDAGFLRDNAHLAVILVGATDDASPRPVSEYASFLSALKGEDVVVFAAAPSEAPRLRGFSQLFPLRSDFELIDALGANSLAEQAYARFVPFGPKVVAPCFDAPLLDLDAEAPGVQPDCVVEDAHQVIPRCGTTPQFPCWRVTTDEYCVAAEHQRIDVMRGDFDPPDNNLVVAQCVSR